MELIGKVVKLGNLLEGQSGRGPWRKQELIIETDEKFPRKVCVLCWNATVDEINRLQTGHLVKIQFTVESREFNGKWYTDVTARQIDVVGAQAPQTAVQHPTPAPQPTPAPLPPVEEEFLTDNGDDLPF